MGKDYKHLIFYLCLKEDLEQSEELEKNEKTDDEKSDDEFNLNHQTKCVLRFTTRRNVFH